MKAKGLVEALWPLVRRRVLAALLIDPDRDLHLSEIVRRTSLAASTVQREVVALSEAGILLRRVEGRQVYYRANRACPIFPELRGIVLKTVGLGDLLREALEPLGQRVRLAFVFGSMADGTAGSDSDVDLMVVGNASLEELAPHLRGAREALARDVNAVTMSEDEFAAAAREQDHFVATVTSRPVIMVKGERDELSRHAQR